MNIEIVRPLVSGAIVPNDDLLLCNPAAPVSIALCSPRGTRKAKFLFNLSANAITFTMADASVTINGLPTYVWTGQYSGIILIPDGISNWFVAGSSVVGDLATLLAAKDHVGNNAQQVTGATITTTGNSDAYLTAPYTGALVSASINPLLALATDDTNFLTFTITNLGQANSGSTAMLAATNPNTTKTTGGSALAVNVPRALVLNGVDANLAVVAGDLLRIRAAASGTLAGQVTRPIYTLVFAGS